jgi:hypothetical protein
MLIKIASAACGGRNYTSWTPTATPITRNASPYDTDRLVSNVGATAHGLLAEEEEEAALLCAGQVRAQVLEEG